MPNSPPKKRPIINDGFCFFCSHLKDHSFLQPTFLLQLRVFECSLATSPPCLYEHLLPQQPLFHLLLFTAFSRPGGGAALDSGVEDMEYGGKSGDLSGSGYSGSGSVGKEGEMSLEELLAIDFRDSASLKASRRKRMARQRRHIGSYFPLPGLLLPSVAPPCPSPNPRAMGDAGLRCILQKELRYSTVSSLGRIVLPKKAKSYIPVLTTKKGVLIPMDDWVG